MKNQNHTSIICTINFFWPNWQLLHDFPPDEIKICTVVRSPLVVKKSCQWISNRHLNTIQNQETISEAEYYPSDTEQCNSNKPEPSYVTSEK